MTSESIEIYLNSKYANKYVNNTTANCIFHLPNIEVSKDEKAYINVKSAVIPFSWYNVNSTNNKLNILVDNANTYNIQIPFGNYNINQLIAYIHSQIATFSVNDKNLILNYSPQTNKITFTNTLKTFQLLNTSTCFELLGFEENKTYTSVNTSGTIFQLISEICINLFVVRQIYVASDNFILNNINANNPSDSNILASISVTGNPNSIIHYSNTASKHLIHHLNNISNLRIQLVDQDGDLLELNNVHWSITIELIISTFEKS